MKDRLKPLLIFILSSFMVNVIFSSCEQQDSNTSPQPQAPQSELKKGLVAYYPFNGNANDESNYENHGTVEGASLTADRSGNPESAYSFDGLDDYIKIDHSESLNLTDSLSISVWVWLNEIHDYNMILAKRFYNYTQYQINVTGGREETNPGDINFFTGNFHEFSLSFPTQSWTHILITANDIADKTKCYINGSLVNTDTTDADLDSTDKQLRIGDNTWMNGNWDGKIDNIRIYNRILNTNEVQKLYNQ